jgi:hypothetical protein
MHPVAEVEAWNALANGTVELSTDLRDEFRLLITSRSLSTKLGSPDSDPNTARDIAVEKMRRWRAAMNADTSPSEKAIMRVALRSFELLYKEAEARINRESNEQAPPS